MKKIDVNRSADKEEITFISAENPDPGKTPLFLQLLDLKGCVKKELPLSWFRRHIFFFWVPIASGYMMGKFIQEELEDPKATKWVIFSKQILSMIPGFGLIALAFINIFLIFERVRLSKKKGLRASSYICGIFFPAFYPYTLRNKQIKYQCAEMAG